MISAAKTTGLVFRHWKLNLNLFVTKLVFRHWKLNLNLFVTKLVFRHWKLNLNLFVTKLVFRHWKLNLNLFVTKLVFRHWKLNLNLFDLYFRRFVWNFFRLENEHLNNCGQFRAVRDISIAPIDSSDLSQLIDLMDGDQDLAFSKRLERRPLLK